jgi:hypothetical protein
MAIAVHQQGAMYTATTRFTGRLNLSLGIQLSSILACFQQKASVAYGIALFGIRPLLWLLMITNWPTWLLALSEASDKAVVFYLLWDCAVGTPLETVGFLLDEFRASEVIS